MDVKAEPSDTDPLKEELDFSTHIVPSGKAKPEEEDAPTAEKSESIAVQDANDSPRRASGESQRAVFVGNFPPTFSSDDIEEMFARHGKVSRVDKKQNFAFVFMEHSNDAEEAISDLSGKAIGRPPRTLRVEWSRGDGAVRRREVARRSRALPPNETLFVVNYDPEKVAQKDLEELFQEYGRIVRIELHGQFSFVQYETVEMATNALNRVNGLVFKNRSLIVEYTIRKESAPRSRYSSSRSSESTRGYGGRSYGADRHMNGGYGGAGGYGSYARGGSLGVHSSYGMPSYSNGSGGGDGRYERNRYSSRSSAPRRRDDDYGWSAALIDRRSKRALSPRRSLSPRRNEPSSAQRKDRKSRSRSRSRSPGRSRVRGRRDRSRSPSPKKRRTSKERSLSRSPVRSPIRTSEGNNDTWNKSEDRTFESSRKDQGRSRTPSPSREQLKGNRSRSSTPDGRDLSSPKDGPTG